jgi:hypothetical protein
VGQGPRAGRVAARAGLGQTAIALWASRLDRSRMLFSAHDSLSGSAICLLSARRLYRLRSADLPAAGVDDYGGIGIGVVPWGPAGTGLPVLRSPVLFG